MNGALTTIVLPLSLTVIMFGMGTSLVTEDFKRIFIYPKAVAIGIVGQILLLPLVGYLFASQLGLTPEISVGVMVLVACAGGATSNMIVYLARGDVALSVTLTAISSCITIFTIPLVINFALFHFMDATVETALPIGSTNMKLFMITLFPVMLGMLVRNYYSSFAIRLEKPMNKLTTVLFVLIIAAILFKERGQFTDYIISAGPVSYFLNLTCMALGFFAARLFRLDDRQSTTVSIEIGVQNSATGIFIAATLLNNSEIAIVPAVYGLVMFLNAGLLLLLMRQSYNKEALKGNR
jgi:BASS family bile acid:Na+ symporter